MGQVAILLVDPALESLPNRPRTEDQEVILDRQAPRDELDEVIEVFLAARLTGGLRGAAATVPDADVVPDVTGGFVVVGHVRFQPLDVGMVPQPVEQDRLVGVDPDERPAGRRLG